MVIDVFKEEIEGKTLVIEKVFDQYDIEKGIEEIAQYICKQYNGEPIVLATIINGGVFFLTDVIKKMQEINPDVQIQTQFLAMEKSYKGNKKIAKPSIVKWFDINITGKNVFLLEDIIHTGDTIREILKRIKQEKPKSYQLITLLQDTLLPKDIKVTKTALQYLGSNKKPFWVGYCLDYEEFFREKYWIGLLK